MLYNLAAVVVVPSLQGNLPLLSIEAQVCGRPVVAFNAMGMKDVIDDRKTGYLAEPFPVEDLKLGVKWVLGDQDGRNMLSAWARQMSGDLWVSECVVAQHLAIYRLAIDDN